MKNKATELGLSETEYDKIISLLGRTPTLTELTVFAGMWSEHCSYKSTKKWLKGLPKDGEKILAGPGSHAGVVAINDDWAVAFKVESHNHPSAVEPYQGAATGVGGILRDIIAQGARPCAVMDALCFDGPNNTLIDGVVNGIGGYGNSFGVPNVGGRIVFHPKYKGNPLVNAMAVGMIDRRRGMRSAGSAQVGDAVIYVGAATGRDGILGAAFASEELSDNSVEDRPHVQVGDPFAGKKLMEALLTLNEEFACQDMGACGITCSAFEISYASKVGMRIDLDNIPLAENDMTPEEIMLSESQERFMLTVHPSKADRVINHLKKGGVKACVCGEVIEGENVLVKYKDIGVVNLLSRWVVEDVPESEWEVGPEVKYTKPEIKNEYNPNLINKEKWWQRYDQTVGNRTVCGPGQAEAAVLKIPNTNRGIALVLESRGDLCENHAYIGAMDTVRQAYLRLGAVGAKMIAITDGINVGSPQNPKVNREIKDLIQGMGDAAKMLGVAITGGNCSLYNESGGDPIPPTLMIGGIGFVEDINKIPRYKVEAGDFIYLLRADENRVSLKKYEFMIDKLIDQIDNSKIQATKIIGIGGLNTALEKLCSYNNIGMEISYKGSIYEELDGIVVVSKEELPDEFQKIGVARGNELVIKEEDMPVSRRMPDEAFEYLNRPDEELFEEKGYEVCKVLVGSQDNFKMMDYYTQKNPSSVEFDYRKIYDREDHFHDVVGFYHTHPSGFYARSQTDMETMKQWVRCLGKDLLCVIEIDGQMKAWLHYNKRGEVESESVKMDGTDEKYFIVLKDLSLQDKVETILQAIKNLEKSNNELKELIEKLKKK